MAYIFIDGDGTHCFARKRGRDYKKRKTISIFEEADHNQANANLREKMQKSFHLWHNCVDSPLVDAVSREFISILTSYTFSLQ